VLIAEIRIKACAFTIKASGDSSNLALEAESPETRDAFMGALKLVAGVQ
jgi:hypothetical protein